MLRTLKLMLLVLFAWLSVEIYSNGIDGALGRVFAPQQQTSIAYSRKLASAPERAAVAVQRAYDQSETRVDRLLEEKGLSKP